MSAITPMPTSPAKELPEYNMTGLDLGDRRHFVYRGPLLDFHSHVMITRPGDSASGPPTGVGPGASIAQAETMLDVAAEFGIEQTVTMCLPDDIPMLRDRFGDRLLFNGPIQKKSRDEPDDAAYRLLDRFLELGVKIIKFWSAPRGRERGLFVDAPWRIESVKRARAAGVKIFMVHVADPDVWFRTVYADAAQVRHQGRAVCRPGTDADDVPRRDLDRRPHGRRRRASRSPRGAAGQVPPFPPRHERHQVGGAGSLAAP